MGATPCNPVHAGVRRILARLLVALSDLHRHELLDAAVDALQQLLQVLRNRARVPPPTRPVW